MSFIQIMDLRTKNFDELRSLNRQWEQATEGKRTLRRSIVARDRNDADHHLVLAFFDSYEDAMKNSNLPETTEFAKKIADVVDGPMQFLDLDVIEDRS